jgi:hypothetical protein
MMRLLGATLLLYTVLGNDKPTEKSDPRLKRKPHKWQTSMDDLAGVKDAAPTKGTWAHEIFGGNSSSAPESATAAAALEAREAAKAREQKTTSTTAKPSAKPKEEFKAPTTTTTTTTTTKGHKYWHPGNETAAPKNASMKPVPAVNNTVNFHSKRTLKVASAAPSGPAAAMMGPGPAPAPAPAPLTYEQQVAKLKGDMMTKIKGDSFDADLIIHRPNKVPPGPESAGKETPVGEFKDVGSDFGPYAGAPGFAPAAAPLKHDDISFKTGSLPVDAAHKNRETMTSDFGREYGPDGPVGMHGARPQAGNFQPLQVR